MARPPTTARPPFTVRDMVVGALMLLWDLRDELLRIGFIPLAVSFAASVLLGAWPTLLIHLVLLAVGIALMMIFSVAWLRRLLLGPDTSGPHLALRWTRREKIYLQRWLLVNIGPFFGLALAIGLVVLLSGNAFGAILGSLLFLAALLAIIFVQARLSLVLPATAVDHDYRLAQAWADTERCGAVLAVSIFLVELPFAAAILGMGWIGERTLLGQGLPYTLALIENILGYAGVAASLTVYALAFRKCSGWDRRQLKPV
jgi:hypothetical protein